MPEAREDGRGDVEEADERTGPADEHGDDLRAGAAEYASHPTRAARNPVRHFPIYPDRHRIP
ncbi:hypothetical protein ACE1SV_26940 [Streptomyces sennicomposti]